MRSPRSFDAPCPQPGQHPGPAGQRPHWGHTRLRGPGLVVALVIGTLATGPEAMADPAVAPGIISTVAGTGSSGFTGDDGSATLAKLTADGIAGTTDGGLLIVDAATHRVRKVLNGTIRTVAGTGTPGGGSDGPAATSQLNTPVGVAGTADGGFLIVDRANFRIRKVSAAGFMTTVAGTGLGGFSGDGGPATLAQLTGPWGVTATADGGFLIADINRVRRVSPAGVITTVAGTGTAGYNGEGPVATVNVEPYDVAEAADGSILVAEPLGNRIRRIAGGVVTTVAGGGATLGDGGPATSGKLDFPFAVDAIPGGGFYISDHVANRVRRVDAAGIITTVLGDGTGGSLGDGSQATSAQVYAPKGVVVLPDGGILVGEKGGNRVRRIEGTERPTFSEPPVSPTKAVTVTLRGLADVGSTVTIYPNPTCSGAPSATGTSVAYGSTGIATPAPPNTTTLFSARATALGFASACTALGAPVVQDGIAPNTIITKVKRKGDTVKLTLASTEAGSTFLCALDKKAARPCTSGKKYKKLTPGKHKIRVTATDVAGNVDATPATKKVAVKK